VKRSLRRIFSPLLNIFESGEEPFSYKRSHRTILVVVGGLFLVLALGVAVLGVHFNQTGAIIPFVVFFSVALSAIVVGTLGSDRAVSKIWGNK